MAVDTNRRTEVYLALGRLEAALADADLLTDDAPPRDLLLSPQPFSFDTLSCGQWLQWQFIPRMRALIERGEALPASCAIYPYAEECLQSHEHDVAEVLLAIRELDTLISGAALQTAH
jgi:uncharacterized protein YqcC (DUF446 family)